MARPTRPDPPGWTPSAPHRRPRGSGQRRKEVQEPGELSCGGAPRAPAPVGAGPAASLPPVVASDSQARAPGAILLFGPTSLQTPNLLRAPLAPVRAELPPLLGSGEARGLNPGQAQSSARRRHPVQRARPRQRQSPSVFLPLLVLTAPSVRPHGEPASGPAGDGGEG